MSRIRKSISITTIVAAAFMSIALTACSPEPQTVKITTASPTVTSGSSAQEIEPDDSTVATPPSEPILVDASGATAADLEAYLTSPERNARFSAVVAEAAPIIAEALNNGEFGEVKRYTDWKEPLPEGYTGWGGISTISESPVDTTKVFAWVWWNADGTIDLTKPIDQLSITYKENPDLEVMLFGPNSVEDYWVISRTNEAYTESNWFAVIDVTHFGWGTKIDPDNGDVVPASLQGFKELDDVVIAQLEANMVSWFGEDRAG